MNFKQFFHDFFGLFIGHHHNKMAFWFPSPLFVGDNDRYNCEYFIRLCRKKGCDSFKLSQTNKRDLTVEEFESEVMKAVKIGRELRDQYYDEKYFVISSYDFRRRLTDD